MKNRVAVLRAWAPWVSRIVAAIVGGYVLGALTCTAALALPLGTSEAAFVGMLSSFLVYAAAAIWVYAVRSALRAWVGLLVAAVPLLLASGTIWRAGGGT